ncbi:MAG: S8 family serine peptidase, partial [Alphaproteobacteria bacterium]|nr:S8 family serine peptidase [Alphaproteobacteria bacterium]
MANYRWKSRAVRARGIAFLALGLVLAVWGSRGVVAVTPEPGGSPAAQVTPPGLEGKKAPPGQVDKDKSRIANGLKRKLETVSADTELRVIVIMDKGKGAANARAAVGPFTLRRSFTIINGFAATMTRAQIEELSQAPGVVNIHEDIEVKAYLQEAKGAFGVNRVHSGNTAEELAADYDGSGVGLCVIDTGIDPDHADLDGGKVQNFCDATNGGCFPGDTGSAAYDDHGHGTHVASIAAGDNGVAPAALLWGAKVLDSAGSGTSGDIVAGIEWCAAQPGVDVLNLSLGSFGSSDGSDPMAQAANNAAQTKVVVLAAGNTGPGLYEISTPAAAADPITVGAVADLKSPVGGWRKGLAVFSSRGPTADDRTKPDIVSPGVDITAAQAGGGLTTKSGTSMSAPFVAGVAALMLHANPALSPGAVKDILGDTAIPRGDQTVLDADGRPKNIDFGWGEVDAYAAVAEAEGASTYTPTPFPVELYQNPTIADGTVWDYEFEVTDPNTPVSVNVINGGNWRCTAYLFGSCFQIIRGQDFDAQLFAPDDTMVDESTCEVDGDTQCGGVGRQETLVANPADFGGGVLPLGTWRLHVEPWSDTDGKASENAEIIITLGPVGGGVIPVPQGTIAGTVTDGTPGAPSFGQAVAGATVTADGGENTTTDASGAYSLVVPAGERSVTVTATGFDPVTLKNITVADGATVTENFALIDANDPPSFLSDPIAGAPAEAGTAYAGTLVGTASDPDSGDVLTYSKVSGPAWLSVAGNGALSGTPGTAGDDSFEVAVNDGNGGSDQATLEITVAAAPPAPPAPANDPPVANDDSVATPEDTAAAVTLTGSDPENDPLTFAVVTQPTNGSLSGTAPILTYTPNLNYFGPDSFTFKANDGTQDSNTATV